MTAELDALYAVMENVDPATWPGLTVAQRCALGRFAKPVVMEFPVSSVLELKVGHVYRAKRPARSGTIFKPVYNDRMIVWVSAWGNEVQYDSPSVSIGRKLPIVSKEKFLSWAGKDVTEGYPKSEWMEYPR